MEEEGAVSQAFAASIKFAQGTERLRAASVTIEATAAAVRDLGEFEPALAPELSAVMEHLGEAAEALVRAVVFLDARLAARFAEIMEDVQ